MKTHTLPGTTLEVSRIAYGCMRIGGSATDNPPTADTKEQAMAAVRAALDQGVNLFDHADIYREGRSEDLFSLIWKGAHGLRQRIIVQSKCGIRPAGHPLPGAPGRYDFSYEHIVESVTGSLRRLKTDYLDLLLLHRPDALVEPDEVARAFDALKQSGKVRFFGVSNHTAAQIQLLQKSLDQPLVVNQVKLSVLHTHLIDEGIAFNRDDPPRTLRSEGTLEYCRLHDITLQAWSPLAKGAATGGSEATYGERARNVSALVADLARHRNVSREAIVIAWILRHPAQIQPIVGSTKPARIRGACQADSIELTREEWYSLYVAGRGYRVP